MKINGKLWLTKEEWQRSIGPIWRGGIIGFVIGVLPGAGGTIASIMSYTTEKRLSKHPEEFGHGAIEGVAGPESANNSDTAGALVPLLTLGVPGGGATAVILGAFIMYGVQPGPMLFQSRPDLVWGLINSMYIGNIMLVILNLPLIGLFVRLLYIPVGILYPLIVAISAIGAYAINGSTVDLWLILGFGCGRLCLRQARYSGRTTGAVAGAGRHHGTVVPPGDDHFRRRPEDFLQQRHHRDAAGDVGDLGRAAVHHADTAKAGQQG